MDGAKVERGRQGPIGRAGEITLERINIVDEDGKTRLVISDSSRSPDPVVGGRTFTRNGPRAPGLIFYNGEGDESRMDPRRSPRRGS